jgi:hypothetical protein
MRELFLGAVREAEAVGRALGVAMAPGIVDQHWQSMLKLPADARSSMRQDIVAGRRLELDSLDGAIVRLGHKAGVPTPLNFAIYAGLRSVQRRIDPGSKPRRSLRSVSIRRLRVQRERLKHLFSYGALDILQSHRAIWARRIASPLKQERVVKQQATGIRLANLLSQALLKV